MFYCSECGIPFLGHWIPSPHLGSRDPETESFPGHPAPPDSSLTLANPWMMKKIAIINMSFTYAAKINLAN